MYVDAWEGVMVALGVAFLVATPETSGESVENQSMSRGGMRMSSPAYVEACRRAC